MSQSGDTPQQHGVSDRFLAMLTDGEFERWAFSDEDHESFDAFREECHVAWEAEEAADAAEANARAAAGQLFVGGPTIPAGLDLSEAFAAVPPEHMFDEDFREEFLYTDYLPADYLQADGSPAAEDPAAGLRPFQRRQARFVDRVLYFGKIIAWAQAGPNHEHDWDATFAAQQGLVAEMACALRIPADYSTNSTPSPSPRRPTWKQCCCRTLASSAPGADGLEEIPPATGWNLPVPRLQSLRRPQ